VGLGCVYVTTVNNRLPRELQCMHFTIPLAFAAS
jgi:hypothetical protein